MSLISFATPDERVGVLTGWEPATQQFSLTVMRFEADDPPADVAERPADRRLDILYASANDPDLPSGGLTLPDVLARLGRHGITPPADLADRLARHREQNLAGPLMCYRWTDAGYVSAL